MAFNGHHPGESAGQTGQQDLLIVTGLSGAGKSSAMKALEDIGFYCVDNIPPALLSTFVDICRQSGGRLRRLAIVTDLRGGELFRGIPEALDRLGRECSYRVLFLDCDDEIIIRRQKESRRKHPLQDSCGESIQSAIERERELLAPIYARADIIIDTSNLTAAELRERMVAIFGGAGEDPFLVRVISFGFKYGLPSEADLVFDVRCLPNPFYIPELKPKTGLDAPVRDYVMQFAQSQELLQRLCDLLDFLLPHYRKEGKRELVIAFGCTGGHHRSVTFAERMRSHLAEKDVRVLIHHRDIKR